MTIRQLIGPTRGRRRRRRSLTVQVDCIILLFVRSSSRVASKLVIGTTRNGGQQAASTFWATTKWLESFHCSEALHCGFSSTHRPMSRVEGTKRSDNLHQQLVSTRAAHCNLTPLAGKRGHFSGCDTIHLAPAEQQVHVSEMNSLQIGHLYMANSFFFRDN